MQQRYAASVGERVYQLTVEAQGGGRWRVVVDGKERVVDARRVEGGLWSLLPEGGGRAILVDVDGPGAEGEITATALGRSYAIKLGDPRRAIGARAARAESGPLPVRAPMPGKVIKVLVKPGDAVKAGQGVVVVEAMKMENELRAARDGKVETVSAEEGKNVESGQVLLTIA